MYLPAAFVEADLTKLHDFIEQNSFGVLVSQAEGLNQNHPAERRQKVVRALLQRGGDDAHAVAAMTQAMLPGEG